MTNSAEESLQYIIAYKRDERNFNFRQWFLKIFETNNEHVCSLEEFAVYFLNTLRQYAESHLKTNGTETPKCQTPVKTLISSGENAFTSRNVLMDSLEHDDSKTTENRSMNASVPKTNISIDFEMSPSPIPSTSFDRLSVSHGSTSTPVRHLSHESSSTPVRRNTSANSRVLSNTPTSTSKKHSSSLCLGDFLNLDTPTISRSSKKKTTPSQQSSQKMPIDKPKKRVQPISISKSVEKNKNKSYIFAGESSFSNENNILKISNNELEDKDQCAVLAARKSLARNDSEITKEIKDVSVGLANHMTEIITAGSSVEESPVEEVPLDIKSVQNDKTLKRLAQIYALIVDLNLATNILNELSFLLNLLNVSLTNGMSGRVDHLHRQGNALNDLSMLEDGSKAISFALLCLEHQKLALASLDAKSLGVVLINERFSLLNSDVKRFLTEIYQRKQMLAMEKPFTDYYLHSDSKTYNNVYFQHEHDSRDNFVSNLEFNNFKAQRDLFYQCLRIWESNHLNPTWKFALQLTPTVNEIIYMSENCVNMAHLAKLFVSQLLLSASNASSPEDIGVEVDLHKFSKLSQRLIAPSQFCVDYQFPRTEVFFRDFILEARSHAFAEQLKMELYTQLTIQNSSSLDHINISKSENDADDGNASSAGEGPNFIVRPDVLNSLLILAKFLGFVVSLPFSKNSGSTMPAKVEKNQIRLRSLMQTTFDVHLLLEEAFEQGKLLIVIPWLVQFFAMLDNVTLQLKSYMRVLKLLFALYSFMGSENPKPFCSTSVFTIRLCLGWLFESKQMIAEEYYNYRAKQKENSVQKSTSEFDFIKSKLQHISVGGITSRNVDPNPRLEALLPVACPFLAEFRVSIMPAKYAQTKLASRTGRYRHITTRIAELPSPASKQTTQNSLAKEENDTQQTQNSLIQAFLHSQSSSTVQIIKFCTERCYKSTVKDGQIKILLPAKTNADNLVNQIDSFQYHFVYNSIKTIYLDAYAQVKAEWEESMPKVLHKRITNALDSLLPEETSSVLKETYLMIIEKEAYSKMFEWFFANITDNYFCSDLQELAEKVCNANKNKVQLGSNQVTVASEIPSVSDQMEEFQYWLHCTSVRLDRFKDSKPIVELLKSLTKAFENELPYFFYHLLGTIIIKILRNIITRNCAHLTEELVEAACQICSHPNMVEALKSFSSNDFCIYDALVNKTFIDSLGTRRDCFQHLEFLIISLIKQHIITVSYANEMFLSLFKHDFDPIVLAEISNMLKAIAQATADVPTKCNVNDNGEDDEDDVDKSNLFMEMLADLSRDVDFL